MVPVDKGAVHATQYGATLGDNKMCAAHQRNHTDTSTQVTTGKTKLWTSSRAFGGRAGRRLAVGVNCVSGFS